MTNAEMEQVFLAEIPVKEFVLDSGICEFYEENDKSIGVSYETSEETGTPVYIFNIFLGDEYVNICGEFESILDAVDVVTSEWNKY